MKKTLLALAAVALLFATSCKKESVNPAIDVPEGSFLATIDNGANPQNAPRINDGMGTMTTIDANRYVIWETGDQISINGEIYTTNASGNSVIFSGGNATGSKFHAFYPATIAGEGAAGVLPDTQTYVSGKVSNLPMYACSENNQLEFHNICAVLKIIVPAFVNGATRIEVSSDKTMNGAFSVDNNSYTASMFNETPSDAEKKVTIVKSGNAAFATNDTVYIAVPANEYGSLKVEFLDGTTSLWTKTVTNQTLVANKVYNINATPVGLCFTYIKQGKGKTNCTIKLSKASSPNTITIDTCTYNASTKTYTNWGSYTNLGGNIVLNNVGDKVYFRAGDSGNSTFSQTSSKYYKFSASDSVEVSGNIMTLLSQTPSTTLPSGSSYVFNKLFTDMSTLKSAENLILPATTLVDYCYENMFNGCKGLTAAPVLPATNLANYCYSKMFYQCTSLTAAPALPATTLAWNCYNYMFYQCTSLTAAPVLPATTLAWNCYNYMFSNCVGLTAAPVLPATTLKGSCYAYMFHNCSGLTAAPVLPATTLADSCYINMFRGCTGLTQTPALPATTLAVSCYESMFYGCKGLTTVSALPATTLVNSCYYEMFYQCTALTTAPTLPATTLADYCYSRMFYNCTNLESVTMKATDVSALYPLFNWLYNAGTSTGTHILYVDHSMISNSTITGYRGKFTVQAYNPPQ